MKRGSVIVEFAYVVSNPDLPTELLIATVDNVVARANSTSYYNEIERKLNSTSLQAAGMGLDVFRSVEPFVEPRQVFDSEDLVPLEATTTMNSLTTAAKFTTAKLETASTSIAETTIPFETGEASAALKSTTTATGTNTIVATTSAAIAKGKPR